MVVLMNVSIEKDVEKRRKMLQENYKKPKEIFNNGIKNITINFAFKFTIVE